MRDFFIGLLEKLVGLVVVLLIIGVVVGAGAVLVGGDSIDGAPSGPLAALGILVFGAIYVIFVAGFMYLGLGIYQNTKRTAEALERTRGSGLG